MNKPAAASNALSKIVVFTQALNDEMTAKTSKYHQASKETISQTGMRRRYVKLGCQINTAPVHRCAFRQEGYKTDQTNT